MAGSGGAGGAEELGVDPADGVEVGRVGEVDAGSDDVLGCGAEPGERLDDDLEAATRLGADVRVA